MSTGATPSYPYQRPVNQQYPPAQQSVPQGGVQYRPGASQQQSRQPMQGQVPQYRPQNGPMQPAPQQAQAPQYMPQSLQMQGKQMPGPAPFRPQQSNQRYPAQPNQHQQGQIQDVIAKAAVKNKFLDFRNNLVHANVADYAMLHGLGGAKYAAKSTIKMMMTDYTVRNNAIVVSANIPPELPYELLEVCKKNMGVPTLDIQSLMNCVNSMSRETKLPPSGNGAEYLAIPASAIQQLQSLLQGRNGVPASAGIDYSYHQERVNVYAQRDGFVPVSSVLITRNGLRGTEISRLPWTVKISNFYAKPNPQQNGTTAYIGASAQNKKEVFINLSDADMFRCVQRVTRFLEIWEETVCTKLVNDGLATREQERAAARAYNNNQ